MNDLEFLYQSGFNAEKALAEAGDGTYEPIPAGWYRVQVKQAEVVPTKAGTGRYLKLRLDVEGPSHAGRVLFTNINLQNPSAAAQEIGQVQFARLEIAVGLKGKGIRASQDLVGRTCEAQVGVEPAKTGKDGRTFEARNDVKSFRKPADAGAAASSFRDEHIPF